MLASPFAVSQAAGAAPPTRRPLMSEPVPVPSEAGAEVRLPPAAAVAARVEDGAAWLDIIQPGWSGLVDLAVLDLDDPDRCVLGQVFGGFLNAPTTLDDAADHGCLAYPQLRNDRSDAHRGARIRAELAMLATAWRDLILRRRQAPAGVAASAA